MATDRQWFSEGVQLFETGGEEWFAEGVQFTEDQAGSALSITFDADGTNSAGWTDSDTDAAFFDDCNDDPDSSSADYIQSPSSHGAGTNTYDIWLRLADVPADFDSMDTLNVRVDVHGQGTVSNDTHDLAMQIFDSDSGGTENALTDSQEIASEADSTRTQRTVNFGSLTGTKAQWNSAYCRIRATNVRTASDDGLSIRLHGASFSGTYTAVTFDAATFPHLVSPIQSQHELEVVSY